ncbi:hypothetical protein J6590_045901 [Homalodisca vitripennis]|nr:hypothetical protein J6590_045901 [Homalodisca vitripennis]
MRKYSVKKPRVNFILSSTDYSRFSKVRLAADKYGRIYPSQFSHNGCLREMRGCTLGKVKRVLRDFVTCIISPERNEADQIALLLSKIMKIAPRWREQYPVDPSRSNLLTVHSLHIPLSDITTNVINSTPGTISVDPSRSNLLTVHSLHIPLSDITTNVIKRAKARVVDGLVEKTREKCWQDQEPAFAAFAVTTLWTGQVLRPATAAGFNISWEIESGRVEDDDGRTSPAAVTHIEANKICFVFPSAIAPNLSRSGRDDDDHQSVQDPEEMKIAIAEHLQQRFGFVCFVWWVVGWLVVGVWVCCFVWWVVGWLVVAAMFIPPTRTTPPLATANNQLFIAQWLIDCWILIVVTTPHILTQPEGVQTAERRGGAQKRIASLGSVGNMENL